MKLDTAGQVLTALDSLLGPLPVALEDFLRANRGALVTQLRILPGTREVVLRNGDPVGWVKGSAVHQVRVRIRLDGGVSLAMAATWPGPRVSHENPEGWTK